MIVITIAFVSGIPAAYMPESLNAETSHAYHAQVSFISVVCRSSDSSIQAARLIAAYDLAPYCQRIASAFSPSHDSPSNDRFSPHAGISRMENNTLESQLLSEFCRALAILNVQTADPATESFRVRDSHPIPLFSEQECVSDCSGRAFATKAMLFNFSMRAPDLLHTKRPLLPCYLADKRSLVFSVYSVSVYAKTTFLFK